MDYEILYDLPEGEYDGRGIRGIRTKTIRSGSLLEVMCYPITKVSAAAKREAWRRRSSASQERMNAINTQRHMDRLIEANFLQGDHVLTLTYEYPAWDRGAGSVEFYQNEYQRAGVPWDIASAARDFKNFIKRVKRAVKRLGGETKAVKYLYVIESGKEPAGGGLPPRYHMHAVLHAPALTLSSIREIWGRGFTRCDGLELNFNGAERLSKYFTKQRRYERRWGHSKNLVIPENRAKISDRRVSRRRAARIAADVQHDGRAIFEQIYPDYRMIEDPRVTWSDFIPGAYIYARMRRRD